MYVGPYKNGKFHGKGSFILTKASTPGPIIPDTRDNSWKEQEKATACGWPTISTPTPTDTKEVTNMTRKMALESITGRITPHTRGISWTIWSMEKGSLVMETEELLGCSGFREQLFPDLKTKVMLARLWEELRVAQLPRQAQRRTGW